MRLIGDIHGDGARYAAATRGVDHSIQVGDLGMGFANGQEMRKWPCRPGSRHFFIRGNHDNPSLCRSHPQFIESGGQNEMFFVNGAWSIDRASRQEGIDWWSDEEHSDHEFDLLLNMWVQRRPKVVISHDCPWRVSQALFSAQYPPGPSRTARALQLMFESHQPFMWVFGHWHIPADRLIGNTRFICLAPGQCIDVPFEYKGMDK